MNENCTVEVWVECNSKMTEFYRYTDVKKVQLFTEGNITVLSLLRENKTNTSFPLNRVIRYQIIDSK